MQGHCFVSDSSKKGAFNPEAQLCSDPCSHGSIQPCRQRWGEPCAACTRCCGMEMLQDPGQHERNLLHLSEDTGFLETHFACKAAHSLCQWLHSIPYLLAAGLLHCPVPCPAKPLSAWGLCLETASVKTRGSEHPGAEYPGAEHPSPCSAAS